jgi:hypothetical protein
MANAQAQKRLKQAQTVALGCQWLPIEAHGKGALPRVPFMLPFSPDTIRWRRAAILELRKLGVEP